MEDRLTQPGADVLVRWLRHVAPACAPIGVTVSTIAPLSSALQLRNKWGKWSSARGRTAGPGWTRLRVPHFGHAQPLLRRHL